MYSYPCVCVWGQPPSPAAVGSMEREREVNPPLEPLRRYLNIPRKGCTCSPACCVGFSLSKLSRVAARVSVQSGSTLSGSENTNGWIQTKPSMRFILCYDWEILKAFLNSSILTNQNELLRYWVSREKHALIYFHYLHGHAIQDGEIETNHFISKMGIRLASNQSLDRNKTKYQGLETIFSNGFVLNRIIPFFIPFHFSDQQNKVLNRLKVM